MPFAFPTTFLHPRSPINVAHSSSLTKTPSQYHQRKKKPNDWDWHYHHSLSAGGPSQSHQTRGNDAWVPAAGKFAERGCYVITINLLGSPLLLILLILLVLLLGCGRWGQPFGYETATTTTTKQSKKKEASVKGKSSLSSTARCCAAIRDCSQTEMSSSLLGDGTIDVGAARWYSGRPNLSDISSPRDLLDRFLCVEPSDQHIRNNLRNSSEDLFKKILEIHTVFFYHFLQRFLEFLYRFRRFKFFNWFLWKIV